LGVPFLAVIFQLVVAIYRCEKVRRVLGLDVGERKQWVPTPAQARPRTAVL